MDFLVAGLGFGALLVLAGYATREFGVFLFVPTRVRKRFDEDAELAASWRGLCRVAANVTMVSGLVMWLALVVAIAFSFSDQMGAYLVAGLATALSVAGAAVIYHTFSRMHEPSIPVHADAGVAEAGWLESDVLPEDSTQPFESWKPRILPKPSATVVDDMPTWGAVYEHPLPEEAVIAPVSAEAPVVPTVDAPAGVAKIEIAATDVETPVSAEQPVAAEAPVANEPEPESIELSAEAETFGEDEGGTRDVAATEDDHDDIAALLNPEPEIEPVDQLISEGVAVEPLAEANGSKRFKSSLLADLDEPGTVDVNAKFKSAVLADLSAVRLPDDGPRFRSTTLVDLAPPDEAEVDDPSQANGVANRRR